MWCYSMRIFRGRKERRFLSQVLVFGKPEIGTRALFPPSQITMDYENAFGLTSHFFKIESEGKEFEVILTSLHENPSERSIAAKVGFEEQCRRTHGLILVFDITDPSSFDHIIEKREAVTEIVGPLPTLVVAIKNNLENSLQVTGHEVNSFCLENELEIIETDLHNKTGLEDTLREFLLRVFSHILEKFD